MTPFQIEIELKSPILIKRWLRLDGLLWHCLFAHYGDPEKAVDALPDFLETTPGGYYKASTLAFATQGATLKPGYSEGIIDNVVAVNRATTGIMRSGSDLSPELFAPNSSNGKRYVKVQVKGGPYKNRLDTHPCLHADKVLFHGVGEGNKIADLIDFYIPALGVNANIGFGTIGAVSCRPTANDYSLIDHKGRPARPLPVSDYQALSERPAQQGPAILNPPFRDQSEVLCALPERVRKFQL